MFYDKYKALCAQHDVTPSRAAQDMGFSNATPTIWKKRGATPHGDALKRIADYFGVSIEYLLSDESEEIKKEPAASEGSKLSDDDIKFALFGGVEGEITDEMFEEVKRFAAYVRAREKERKAGGDD